MTLKTVFQGSLILGVIITLHMAHAEKQALATRAKVLQADAEKIALSKTPGGSIEDAELRENDTLLVWSFDIRQPGAANMIQVQVDALSGTIAAAPNLSPEPTNDLLPDN